VSGAHRSATSNTHDVALSFSGSGMMMVWQMGVASVMRSDPSFMARVQLVLGTSGGACVGAMLLASPPSAFAAALHHYSSGAMWRSMKVPHDLLHPHDELMRRTVEHLRLLPEGTWRKLRGRFSAHVTPRSWPIRNVGISDFTSDAELLRAISASCCLSPGGVAFRGQRLLDGGLSDPMPEACAQAAGRRGLPTITISIIAGDGVDVAPDEGMGRRGSVVEGETGCRRRVAEWRRHHTVLRYDASLANARALLDAAVMPQRRAVWRFEQGQQDALKFLRSIGHDPPPSG